MTMSTPAAMTRLPVYLLVRPLSAGKVVVDLGYGTGQGTRLLLHSGPERIIAWDPSVSANHNTLLSQHLQREETGVLELIDTPFDSPRFSSPVADLAICADLFDRFPLKRRQWLESMRAALREDGIGFVVCANPHRSVIGEDPSTNSLDYAEFTALLNEYFPVVAMLGQSPLTGFYLSYLDPPLGADRLSLVDELLSEPEDASHFIGVVSFSTSPDLERYMMVALPYYRSIVDVVENTLEKRIATALQQKIDPLRRKLLDRDAELAELSGKLARATRLDETLHRAEQRAHDATVTLQQLKQELKQQTQVAIDLRYQIDEQRALETRLRHQLVDAERAAEELALERDQAALRTDSFATGHHELLREYQTLKDEHQQSTRQLVELQQTITAMETERDQLIEARSLLQHELTLLRETHQQWTATQHAAVTSVIDRLKAENQKLSTEIKQNAEQHAALVAQLETAEQAQHTQRELAKQHELELQRYRASSTEQERVQSLLKAQLKTQEQLSQTIAAQLETQTQQIAELKLEIEGSRRSNSEKQRDLTQAHATIDLLREEKTQLETQHQKQATTITNLERRLAGNEQKLVETEALLENRNDRLKTLEQTLSNAEAELEVLRAQTQELVERGHLLSDLAHERDRLRLELGSRREALLKAETALADAIAIQREIAAQKEQLEQSLALSRRDVRAHADRELRLQMRIKEVEEQLQQRSDDIAARDDELRQLRDQNARLIAEGSNAESVTAQVHAQEAQLVEIQRQRDAEREKLTHAQHIARTHEQECERLRVELNALSVELSEKTQALSQLDQEKSSLTTRLNEISVTQAKQEQERSTLQAQTATLEKQLEHANTELTHIRAARNTLQHDVIQLTHARELQQRQFETTSSQRDAFDVELSALKKVVSAKEQELAELRGATVEDNTSSTERELTSLRDKIVEIQRQHAAKVSELQSAFAAFQAQAQETHQTHEREIEIRATELEQALRQLEELEGRIWETRDEASRHAAHIAAATAAVQNERLLAQKTQAELTKARQRITEQRVRMNELEEIKQQLREKLTKANDESKTLRKQLGETRYELAVTKHRHHTGSVAVIHEIDDAHAKRETHHSISEELLEKKS